MPCPTQETPAVAIVAMAVDTGNRQRCQRGQIVVPESGMRDPVGFRTTDNGSRLGIEVVATEVVSTEVVAALANYRSAF